MARTTDADKATLLAEIAATRAQLTDATDGLRASMDVPARLRRSVRENRVKWVSAASATALLLVLLRRRKKVVYVERSTGAFLGAAGKAGMVLTSLKLLGALAKPMLGEVAKARLLELATRFAQYRAARAAEHRRNS
jgi:hypothetical protein